MDNKIVIEQTIAPEQMQQLRTFIRDVIHYEFQKLKQEQDETTTLTLRQAAKMLGVAVNTVKKYVEIGALHRLPGGRIPKKAILEFLEKRTGNESFSINNKNQ